MERSLILQINNGKVLIAQRHKRRHHVEVRQLKLRSRLISKAMFSLNSLSEQGSLEHFRFKKRDIARNSDAIGWDGKQEWNFYQWKLLTEMCTTLHKLGTDIRWASLEGKYGKHGFQMSEIIWKVVKQLKESMDTRWSFEVVYFCDERKIMTEKYATQELLQNNEWLLSTVRKLVCADQVVIMHIKDQCTRVTNKYIFSSVRLIKNSTELSSIYTIRWRIDVMT